MMCPACRVQPHLFLDCQFPRSCTCQHRMAASDPALIGSKGESSTDSFTDQEQYANAADRLDA